MAKIPGPVPEYARRRRNKQLTEKIRGARHETKLNIAPNPDWRKDVRNFFNAHLNSGQVDFYQNSDLMTLYLQCELLDRVLRQSRTVVVYQRDGEDFVLDEDGNRVPELDENGEVQRRTVGSVNGQAIKAVVDMSQDLLATEGARRKLRIDLAFPADEDEAPEAALIAKQRASVAKVATGSGRK